MKIKRRSDSPLAKMSRRGFRGYPIVTVVFYGPDDQTASKVALTLVPGEECEPTDMERWFSEGKDVRRDDAIVEKIIAFVQRHQAKSVGVAEGILGCPHEEGIDYPDGKVCPQCPFWARRDRWTGEIIQ